MSTISHKQAISFIRRRLDGLLDARQMLSLEEHLRSCGACRAYADEMDLLPRRLQHEFHTRGDLQPGPSPKVMELVTAKARKIQMTNRFFSGARLLTGVAMLLGLAILINLVVSQLGDTAISASETKTADNSLLAENRLLAFTSDQNGNFEIYTMHTDGTRLINLTNNPARDVNPFWSPDSQRIAFESDRDGFTQIYLMDANGSNIIQLTKDKADHSLPRNIDGGSNPWSPYGSKLLYLQQKPEDETIWLLYSIDINTKAKTLLASGRIQLSNLSWSPDGNFVGYVLNDSATPKETFAPGINVVKADSTNNFAINEILSPKESLNYPFYNWSQDGQSIFFTAYKHINEGQDQWIAYEARIPEHTLIEKATSSTQMQDWWNGTSFIIGNGAGSPLTWLRSDKTYSTLNPLVNCDISDPTIELHYGIFPRRSSNGDQIIVVTCPNNSLLFYYTNSDGTIIKQLLRFPGSAGKERNIINIIWSPDDKFIAVKTTSPERNSMYILNISEALSNPSTQPSQITLDEASLQYEPSWQPIP